VSVEANKQLVRDWVKAVYDGDEAGIRKGLADDAVWVFPGDLPVNGIYEGVDAIVNDLLGTNAMPLYEPNSLTHEITCIVADESNVAVEWRGQGRSAKGKTYDNRYAFFFEVRDGLITSVREHCDTLYVKEVLYA
jgi:uncharacterized protein